EEGQILHCFSCAALKNETWVSHLLVRNAIGVVDLGSWEPLAVEFNGVLSHIVRNSSGESGTNFKTQM
ncbi:hypothetical protein NPIL_19261, partial [Nephila pilipes]